MPLVLSYMPLLNLLVVSIIYSFNMSAFREVILVRIQVV